MVKVINIDTKTRTIRVSNADGDIKTWRTTESGTHFPIKEGQTTKEALDKFVAKKRPEAKQQPAKSGPTWNPQKIKGYKDADNVGDFLEKNDIKGAKANKLLKGYTWDKFLKDAKNGTLPQEFNYADTAARDQVWEYAKAKTGMNDKEFAEYTKKSITWTPGTEKAKKESGPSKDADVSDIIADYKEKMKAAGPRASLKKTDRIEADAIKEFMTRKLGANRPYDDYYQYWLNGMDKDTEDAFNEIYNESEAREMAFSELASDVDHSGLAAGEPTYDELMQWSEKQKAKKAQQQPAKKESQDLGKPGDNIKYVSELLKTPKSKELYDRLGNYAKEHASELPLDHLEHLVALRKILLNDNNAAEHVEKNFQKWFGNK